MASWGLVATVKAPEEKVLAFVAHHLSLGADHIWIYFDDPEDPTHAVLNGHPSVTAILCDVTYWADKRRHDRHQNRQARNARDAYERCTLDWLGHIDVDEFIQAKRAVATILDAVPPEQLLVKLEPFEAMHDPDLPDDIYTARAFRGAIRHDLWPLRHRALGKYREIALDGMLSHSVGKVLMRTGIKNLSPRLHGVMLNGARVPAPHWHPELHLLHFHAQDRTAWKEALQFRLTRGAYMYRPSLQKYLLTATPEEVDAFYLGTQVLPPEIIPELLAAGRLVIADLALRQKVTTLFGAH